jgi:beta-N-acetylhexosaminidase
MFAVIIGVYYAIKENDSELTPVKESPNITKPSDSTVDSNLEKLVEEPSDLSPTV